MNQKTKLAIAGVFILLILAGGFYVIKSNSRNGTEEVKETTQSSEESNQSGNESSVDEYCSSAETDDKMSYTEARSIAEKSSCADYGNLGLDHWCNENSGTWWIDMLVTMEGCNPACVVNVQTKEAEMNWMCTGLR